MNENTKVVVQVEYEIKGVRKVCFGEIGENKVEKLKNLADFYAEEENHLLMENDGKPSWTDNASIISIKRLGVESTIYERPSIETVLQS